MSILENAADLLHELKVAAGTVLTILGSRLEAQERARVECGPQWLNEFEEQRDHLEPGEVCAFHGEWCAGEASWCHHLKDSAAVSAAADPSPNNPRMGDEGSGGDSDILPSPPPERSTSFLAGVCPNPGMVCNCTGACMRQTSPVPPVVAGESPREESTDQPSLGEPRLDSELFNVAADTLGYWICGDANSMAVRSTNALITELRARAGEFEVFEREAAGE